MSTPTPSFNKFTGRMAQIEFVLQLLMKIMAGEDCESTIEQAESGHVFDEETIKSIKRKTKRLYSLPESSKKDLELENFKKKLFSYCGMKGKEK